MHPKYLDARSLVALWRESLLAQAVLAGKTRGYKNHPQLERFKAQKQPLRAIGAYLSEVQAEAERRGYKFDRKRILFPSSRAIIPIADGQLEFEWAHLMKKLLKRDRDKLNENARAKKPALHPIFILRKGGREGWEKSP
jgi:hypothetical protein